MTIEGTLDLQTSDALLGLRDVQRRQIPFAQALALTRTAQAAQQEIRQGMSKRFTLRSSFVERGVRIKAATKRSPAAEVFWRAPGGGSRRSFVDRLAIQETGGTVRPPKRTIPIPRDVRRGKGGIIPKSQRPARLLDHRNVFLQDARGGAVILQRVGKGRPRLLFFLTDKPTRFEPRFDFKATARATARRVYNREFGKAFSKALATRRR